MGVDPGHEVKTKPQLGTDLLTDTMNAGVRVAWCAADAVYGRDRGLREECEKRQIGYSLGVPCSFRIRLPSKDVVRVDATLRLIPARAWQVASCGPGSKGERHYAFAWLGTASPRHFLLIRRSLTKPTELAYFYCYVPDHVPATLGTLVAVTGRRWTIEEDHEFGRDQFGFDQSPVRRYTPIMRHITLVMVALAVCAVTAAQARVHAQPLPTPTSPTEPPPTDLGLIPLTVVEVKKLFNLPPASGALHQAPPVLVMVAPPSSSPRPVVSPPSPTRMIRSRSTAALLCVLVDRVSSCAAGRDSGAQSSAHAPAYAVRCRGRRGDCEHGGAMHARRPSAATGRVAEA
jgi:hypothetical protein